MLANHKCMMLCLTASIMAVTGCSNSKKEHTQEMPPLEITVANPVVQDITLTKDYPGYLTAFKTVNLVARVNGTLQRINYTPGTEVKQGQLLFVIEPSTYQHQVEEAKAQLANAQAQYAYAKASYDRTKEASISNAVSEISVIQTEANMNQAKASVEDAKAALANAELNLSYCYVTAPCSGRITKNQYDLGNYINGASSPVLATVYDDKQLYAYFDVSDNQYLNAYLNSKNNSYGKESIDSVTVLPSGDNTFAKKAKVDYLGPNVTLSTGTVEMRAVLDNHVGELRDGLYVRVILPYANKNQAVLIPEASIGNDQRGRFVYLVNDSNIVKYTPVQVGQLMSNNLREIVSGVKSGDKYVVNGLLKVRNDMPIKPVEAK
ncbi:MAG: efflux RND transporter periplasmic adaptor subunit [Tannerellaceae bacterium]